MQKKTQVTAMMIKYSFLAIMSFLKACEDFHYSFNTLKGNHYNLKNIFLHLKRHLVLLLLSLINQRKIMKSQKLKSYRIQHDLSKVLVFITHGNESMKMKFKTLKMNTFSMKRKFRSKKFTHTFPHTRCFTCGNFGHFLMCACIALIPHVTRSLNYAQKPWNPSNIGSLKIQFI